MTLLPRPWSLWDVEDVEALLGRAVARSGFARELRPVEREDLLADLFRAAWQLSQAYDPGRGVAFSSYLYAYIQRRAIDWYRRERGRTRWVFAGYTYERRRPQLVSVDELEFDPVGDADAGGAGDSPADRFASLNGLVDEAGRSTDRDLALIRGLVGRPARRRA